MGIKDDYDWISDNYWLPEGWNVLVSKLCADIQPLVGDDFKVHQVKEKFGGLRFYVSDCSDEVHEIIDKAENDSFTICQKCSAPGERRNTDGWLATLCDTCSENE